MTSQTHFPTALGECTLSWSDAGLTAFALPAAPAPTRSLSPTPTRSPAPPSACAPLASPLLPFASCPPHIATIVARVQRHLSGNLQDFADLAYDWSIVTVFQRRVLRALLAIKPGLTATYGDLARAIGAKPSSARAIGGAVGANPWPLLIPCHRILGAGGKLTGYSAPGGIATKARLLALEGVELAG